VRSSFALFAAIFALTSPGLVLGQQVDRATRPAARPGAPFKFPTIRTHTLASGLRLLVVEDHSIPVVAVRAIVGADSTSDEQGKEGLYDVTLGALREGSTAHSADELAAAAAVLGTTVVPTGFTTVSSEFVPALGLMSEMLINPAFDSASIERRKAAQEATARRIAQTPVTTPRHLFYSLVYGANDPFVRSLVPTEASAASISRADVLRFYSRFFNPNTTTLAIAGDVTDSAALDAATRAFGRWGQLPRSPRQAEPSAVGVRDTHVYVQDVPNAGTQAYLYVGALGPSRTDSDAAATEAFAAIASARLQETLREKRSFIYSSTTGLTWRHAGAEGTFVGSANVSAQKADSALAEWLRVLRELRTTHPPTEAELDAIRESRVGVLPSRIDGPDSIVTRLAEIARDGLPLDFFERYASRMASVTLADVKSAGRHVDVDHLVIVVTGDARVLERVLSAAKLAPVTVLPPQRGSAP